MTNTLDSLAAIGNAATSIKRDKLAQNDPGYAAKQLQQEFDVSPIQNEQQTREELAQIKQSASYTAKLKAELGLDKSPQSGIEGLSDLFKAGSQTRTNITPKHDPVTNLSTAGDISVGVASGFYNTLVGGLDHFNRSEDGSLKKITDSIGKGIEGFRSEGGRAKADYESANLKSMADALGERVRKGEITQGQAEFEMFKNHLTHTSLTSKAFTGGNAVGSIAAILVPYIGVGATVASTTAEVGQEVYDKVFEKDGNGNYKLSHEELMRDSPVYRETFEKTGGKQEARDKLYTTVKDDAVFSVKNAAGAAIDVLGTQKLVKGLSKDGPLGASSYTKRVAGNVGHEVATENIGETLRHFAGTESLKEQGLHKGELSEGLGVKLAEATTGSVLGSGPFAAVSERRPVSKEVSEARVQTNENGMPVDDAGKVKAPTSMEEAEAASDSVVKRAEQMKETTAQQINEAGIEDPAVLEESNKLFDDIVDTLSWEDIPEDAPEYGTYGTILNGSANAMEAIKRAVGTVVDDSTDPSVRMNMGLWIKDTLSNSEKKIEDAAEILAGLDNDHPILPLINEFVMTNEGINNIPQIKEALDRAVKEAESLDTKLDPNKSVEDQQDNINNLKAKAKLSPENLDLDDVNTIMEFYSQDLVDLTEQEVMSLGVIREILSKQREQDQRAADEGKNDLIDKVGREIRSDTRAGNKGKSAFSHVDDIASSIRIGDTTTAAKRMNRFRNFAQSQVNKFNAVIRSGKTGNPENYETISKSGSKWRTAPEPVTYSKKFATTVGNEAELMAHAYNSLVQAYPELKGEMVSFTPHAIEGTSSNRPVKEEKAAPQPLEEPKTTTERIQDISEEAELPVSKKEPTQPEPVKEKEAEVVEETEPTPAPKEETIQEKTTNPISSITTELAVNEDVVGPIDGIPDSDGSPNYTASVWGNAFSTAAKQLREAIRGDASLKDTKEYKDLIKLMRESASILDSKGYDLDGSPKKVTKETSTKEEKPEPKKEETKKEEPKKEETKETTKKEEKKEDKKEEVEEENPNKIRVLEETNEPEPLSNTRLGRIVSFRKKDTAFQEGLSLQGLINGIKERFNTKENKDKADAFIATLTNMDKVVNKSLDLAVKRVELAMEKLNLDNLKGAQKERYDALKGNRDKYTDEQYKVAINSLKLDIISSRDNGQIANLFTLDPLSGEVSLSDGIKDVTTASLTDFLSNIRSNFNYIDMESLSKLLGMSEGDIYNQYTPEEISVLTRGIGSTRAKEMLADTIKKYLGIRPNKDTFLGRFEGTLQALSAEVLTDLIADDTNSPFTETAIEIDNGQTMRFLSNKKEWMETDFFKSLFSANSLLDEMLLSKPERMYNIGTPPKPSKNKLRDPNTPVTDRQYKVSEVLNNIPFKLDNSSSNLFIHYMSEDNLLDLFGGGSEIQDSKGNTNHITSLRGKNNQVINALQTINEIREQLINRSGETNESITDIPVYFSTEFTSVNRGQMVGAYNPQGSKLVRSVMSPNRSVLDLAGIDEVTTTRDYDNLNDDSVFFLLAQAQALGIKIHNQSFKASFDQLLNKLNGEFKPALDALNTIRKNKQATKEDINTIKQSLGGDLSELAVQALNEWLDYAESKDKNKHTTHMYVESDGVTNGPFNAAVMLGPDPTNPKWVQFVSNGGLFLGRKDTMNNYRTSEADQGRTGDNYSDLANRAESLLMERMNTIYDSSLPPNRERVGKYLKDLKALTSLIFSHIKLDENGNIKMSRNTGKNPLTVTIYGSGTKGIGNQFTIELRDAVHEIMHNFNVGLNSGKTPEQVVQELYPELEPNAAYEKFAQLNAALFEVTKNQLAPNYIKDGKDAWNKAGYKLKSTKGGFKLWDSSVNMNSTLKPDQFNAIAVGLEETIVSSLSTALNEQIPLTMRVSELLGKSTNLLSILLVDKMRGLIDDKIKEYKKNADETGYRNTDFLTQKDMDDISKEMEKYGVKADILGHAFALAKNTKMKADLSGQKYGANTSGSWGSVGLDVKGIGTLGVGGIPRTVIGFGDAEMILSFVEKMVEQDVGTNFQQIFDGINLSGDNWKQGGLVANEAANTVITKNPVKDLYAHINQSVHKLLPDSKFSTIISQQMTNDEILNKYGKETLDTILGSLPATVSALELLEQNIGSVDELGTLTDRIEKGKKQIQEEGYSLDQMAGLATPYVSKDSLPEADVAEDINTKDESTEVQEEIQEKADEVVENTVPRDEEVTDSDDGVMELTKENLADVYKMVRGKDGYGPIVSLVGKSFKQILDNGTKIFVGTKEALAKTSDTFKGNNTVNGSYSIKNNTVSVVGGKGSVRVLLHEVIHANTAKAIVSYYANPKTSKIPTTVKKAITNLETLANDFISGKVEFGEGNEANRAKLVKNRLVKFKDDPTKLVAEFVAHIGSEPLLLNMLNNTENPTPLHKFVGKAWSYIKNIVTDLTGIPNNTRVGDFLLNLGIVQGYQGKMDQESLKGELHSVDLNDPEKSSYVEYLGNTMNELEGLVNKLSDKLTKADLINKSEGIISSFRVAGFNLSKEDEGLFKAILTVVGSEANINKKAKAGLSRLFAHTVKNLKPESFYPEGEVKDEDRYEAYNKYDTVMGVFNDAKTLKGDSTILASFIALTAVDPEFREVLSKIKPPAASKGEGEGLDKTLSKLGHTAIFRLNNHLTGMDPNKPIPDTIIELIGDLRKKPKGNHIISDAFVVPTENLIDKANTILSDGISKLGDKLDSAGSAIKGRADTTKAEKALASALQIIGNSIHKDKATHVAEGLSHVLNTTKAPGAIKSLIRDMIGRTESNKRVYDLIKPVKSFVQKQRQMHVEGVPVAIRKAFKDTPVTKEQWQSLYTSMGKTDISSLLGVMNPDAVLDLLKSKTKLESKINQMEKRLSNSLEPSELKEFFGKANQLANYLVTGKAGSFLLRNVDSIAFNTIGSTDPEIWLKTHGKELDAYITLVALKDSDLDTLKDLSRVSPDGIKFILAYMKGQNKEEKRKNTSNRFNGYKGYIPENTKGNLIIADSNMENHLAKRGYKKVGDYIGSNLDSDRTRRSYYYSSVDPNRPFAQGIMQNVVSSFNGINEDTGLTIGNSTGGLIPVSRLVSNHEERIKGDKAEHGLMPVFDNNLDIIGYERAIDPEFKSFLKSDNRIDNALGVWRGRQAEELTANLYNEVAIDEMKAMWDGDKKEGREEEYVNVLSKDFYKEDPVLAKSVKLLTEQSTKYAEKVFGKGKFMIRRDMLKDSLGYRSLSVAEIFESKEGVSKAVGQVVSTMLGDRAYEYTVKGEELIQGLVGGAKQIIVVKSVVVPVINAVSNVYHLMSRGVPLGTIGSRTKEALSEIEYYTDSTKRIIEIEALIRASEDNPAKVLALRTEKSVINDSIKDLSIYPLLSSGEFTSIVSAMINDENNDLSKGKIAEYLEEKIDGLDPKIGSIVKNGYMTKSSSMYQFLQKATDYGDFIAKAIYYTDMVERQGKSKEEALGRVKEEFINYDVLPGRLRGYLEKMGLLWFYNYKIRSVKIAASIIRENPLNLILASQLPTGMDIGNIGMPLTDNLFYKLGEGTLPYSIGPGMGIRAPNMHPITAILH